VSRRLPLLAVLLVFSVTTVTAADDIGPARGRSATPGAVRSPGVTHTPINAARATAVAAPGSQVRIARVEAMPRVPLPYAMRDWRQVAVDADRLLYDFTAQGAYLPLPWWDQTQVNYPWDCVGLPSYVGSLVPSSGPNHEGVTVMGSVLGATVSGIDKSNQNGMDFVRMVQQYHNKANGENLVLNHTNDDTGHSFWYELLPQVLFTAITAKYPREAGMSDIVAQGADRWYDASVALGGTDAAIPDFDHTAFDFDTMTVYDSGTWREPDAAAGVAFIEYMAYQHLGKPQYVQAADWAVQFLVGRKVNPSWESLLPFGTYIAARLNAEEGRNYDLKKLLDWCFEESPTRGYWGVLSGVRWRNYDVSGLSSSLYPGHGYAFAMDTFSQVGALTPLPRYDNRFARAIGRYVLNAANASRLFYANGLPPEHQSGADWSLANDPQSSIAYEALREHRERRDHMSSDFETRQGTIVSGSYVSTAGQNLVYEVLEESATGGRLGLYHTWSVDAVTPAKDHYMVFVGRAEDGGDGKGSFTFSYSRNPAGPWTKMFTVKPTSADRAATAVVSVHLGTLYIRVVDDDRAPGTTPPDRLYVDLLHVQSFPDVSPYAMGDPINHGWAATDFGIYGAGWAGLFGGIIRTTNVEHLLQLDLLATDYFRGPAHPTYLYYNPHLAAEVVHIDVGRAPIDLYDAVSERILARDVTGDVTFAVPNDSAVVLTLVTSGAAWHLDGRRLLADGVVVDFDAAANPMPESPPPTPTTTSPATPTATPTLAVTPTPTETVAPTALPIETPAVSPVYLPSLARLAPIR
jgi:hypothetical protein